MVKSEIKLSYLKVRSFPKLMIHSNKEIIILAESQEDNKYIGVIVYSKIPLFNPVGKYKNDWINFEDFFGEITLSNEIFET